MIWNVGFTLGIIGILLGVVRGISTLNGFDAQAIILIVVGAILAVYAYFMKGKKK